MNKEIDLLAVISILLGYENLIENREQSAHNDVSAANDKQTQYLLNQLSVLFKEQNKKIDKILSILEENNENNKRINGTDVRWTWRSR